MLTEEAGGTEKRFLDDFGNVVRLSGLFGVRHIFVGYPVPALSIRTLDRNYRYARTGGSLVDRRPQGYQSHPPEIRLFVREAG